MRSLLYKVEHCLEKCRKYFSPDTFGQVFEPAPGQAKSRSFDRLIAWLGMRDSTLAKANPAPMVAGLRATGCHWHPRSNPALLQTYK
jgi:hypothetical protein